MNPYIQKTIASHMKGKQQPSLHDLRCFIGMIETGEATIEDFTAAAGERVAALVESVYDAWSEFYSLSMESATWKDFGPCLNDLVRQWEKEGAAG